MCKLAKIHVLLHQMGWDTRAYKLYCERLQIELDINWQANHTTEYRKYWYKCFSDGYDFTGEYEMAVREHQLSPKEAYDWVFEEFINK